MLLLKTGASASWNDQVKLVVWLPSVSATARASVTIWPLVPRNSLVPGV